MPQVPVALSQAFELHQAGRLQEAADGYRRALATSPDLADAWALLGAACLGLRQLDEAVSHLQEALRLRPDHAGACDNLGIVLVKLGRLEEAVESFQQAARLQPRRAETQVNLGNALAKLGRNDEAVAAFQQALRLKSDSPLLHFHLAEALNRQGRLADAAASYRRLLAVKPDHAESCVNLGSVLSRMDNLKEAEEVLRQAVRLRPGFAEAYVNLAEVLSRGNRLAEAESTLREALRLKPDLSQACNNLGTVLTQQDRYGEAAQCLRQAIALRPDDPDPHYNLGLALLKEARADEALVSLDRALELNPDYAEAHHNRSAAWLLRGEFERAWPEYEWRWKCREFQPRTFRQPRWDGSPLADRTILLFAEQGLGDTLQFVRYAPLVKGRGGRVIVECPAPLTRLLAGCSGIDQLVASGEALPEFDLQVPLMSLPGIFGTTPATIPMETPYLVADPQLVEHWRWEVERLPGFKIGLAWQGNPKYNGDRLRSIPLAQFGPLAAVHGVQFISLQKGHGVEQLRGLPDDFPIIDWSDRLDATSGAFMDTAAVMSNLDLIISSDTAIPHLAGALGRPVWLALPLAPDWRWMLGRGDSPWYPTMRLFRQTETGNWSSVFREIAAALEELFSPGRPAAPLRVEISPGELLDKISILQIKRERISDDGKLRHVRVELASLETTRTLSIAGSAEIETLANELRSVNERLWEIEDEIRLCERGQDFGPRFIELARAVYHNNDRRAALKRQINDLLGSRLVEEKAYQPYR